MLSNSVQPHGLQHARLSCPLSPGVCTSSYPLSWWCYLTISSFAAPFSFHLLSFPASGSFLMKLALLIRWPKCRRFSFSFSISPSNAYSGLISFRIDWLDLPALQGTLTNLAQEEQDGKRSWWMCNTSLSTDMSGIHLQNRRVCRIPAESGQEYMTSRKEYIDPRKTQGQALSL